MGGLREGRLGGIELELEISMKHHTTSRNRGTHYIHVKTVFASIICNKGYENIYTTSHISEIHEAGLIHVLNRDKEAEAEQNKCCELKLAWIFPEIAACWLVVASFWRLNVY